MNKRNKYVTAAAVAAIKAAARKGIDPYNSHAVAAKTYPRIAAMRSEYVANVQLGAGHA